MMRTTEECCLAETACPSQPGWDSCSDILMFPPQGGGSCLLAPDLPPSTSITWLQGWRFRYISMSCGLSLRLLDVPSAPHEPFSGGSLRSR